MRVITRTRLEEFWADNGQAETPLTDWYNAVRTANWRNFADVKALIGTADLVGKCVVFNIGGKKFRLVVAIDYQKQNKDGSWTTGRVYIRNVLTHAEYDLGRWKTDCGAK